MKKFILPFILGMLIVMASSCATVGVNGKASKAEDKQVEKILSVEKASAANVSKRLSLVGEYSYGVSISSNLPTAKTLNDRILTLSVYPSLEKIKEMRDVISSLNSSNELLLIQKDVEILRLQNITKILETDKDIAVNDYIKLADSTASKSDAITEKLKEYTGWFGLSAIFKGSLQLIKSMAWVIGIGGILFIVLRFASFSNPLAASIFSVISRIGSWFVNIIAWIIPQAVEKAGNVSKVLYDKSKTLLNKIVDNIQSIKEIEKRTGKDATLKEVLNELDKSLDTDEKDMISQIKKNLGY